MAGGSFVPSMYGLTPVDKPEVRCDRHPDAVVYETKPSTLQRRFYGYCHECLYSVIERYRKDPRNSYIPRDGLLNDNEVIMYEGLISRGSRHILFVRMCQL